MARPGGVWPPTSEKVGEAWLGTRVAGVVPAQVGMTLPKDVSKWADSGFLQLTAIPNTLADVDLPQRRTPVFQLDSWGAKPGSNQPQWSLANRNIELVRIATEDAQTGYYGMPLDLGPDFGAVRVLAAYFISEPVRVEDDPSGYARFTVDLKLDWVRQ